MLKQILSLFVIIAISALVVFFMPQAQQVLHLLVDAHDWIADVLTAVFNGGHACNIARELVALLCIPLLAGLIPAILFFVIRKRWLPCFMEIVWVIWLLQAGALIMIYAGPATAAPTIATPVTAEEPAAPATTETPAAE